MMALTCCGAIDSSANPATAIGIWLAPTPEISTRSWAWASVPAPRLKVSVVPTMAPIRAMRENKGVCMIIDLSVYAIR